MSDSLRPCGLQHTRLLCPWDFPGKGTGVGSHFLLHQLGFKTEKTQIFHKWDMMSLTTGYKEDQVFCIHEND